MQEFRVSQLSAGSVFIFGYLANLALMMPFMMLCGVIGMAGGKGVFHNGHPVYGPSALIIAFLMGLIFPVINATFLLLGTLILRVLKQRAPLIRIRDQQ